jgi:integrase
LMECLRLRVKDIDFEHRQIVVREAKGGRDRVTVLPNAVVPALRVHLDQRRDQHRRKLALGGGEVYLPYALHRKYPAAGRAWSWQFVFAAGRYAPVTNVVRLRRAVGYVCRIKPNRQRRAGSGCTSRSHERCSSVGDTGRLLPAGPSRCERACR